MGRVRRFAVQLRSVLKLLLALGLLMSMLPPAAGHAAAPAAAVAQQERVIEITAAGIVTPQFEIQQGETVTWRNNSDQTITIQSGVPGETPLRLFVPIALGTRQEAAAPATVRDMPTPSSPNGFGGTLAAGAVLRQRFDATGDYPYYLLERPELTGSIAVAATMIELVQILPDTDNSPAWQAVVQPVVDPHRDRTALVNFGLEAKNIASKDLALRSARFTYTDSGGQVLLDQSVAPDQIKDLLEHPGPGGSLVNNLQSVGKAALLDLEYDTFLADWKAVEDQGFRIFDIETYLKDGKRVYSALFRPASYAKAALLNQEVTAFLQDWQQLEAQGMRMIDFEVYRSGSKLLHIGLFEPGTDAKSAVLGAEWNDFFTAWQAQEAQGLRMVDLEVLVDGGKTLYSGIFRAGTYAPAALVDKQWDAFLAGWQDLEDKGYRLFDIETYIKMVSGQDEVFYAGLFKPGDGPKVALINRSRADFVDNWRELDAQGNRMIDLESQLFAARRLYTGIFGLGPALTWKADSKILLMSPQAGFEGTTPAEVTITLTFDNAATWSYQVPLSSYINRNPAQGYSFFARQSDLPPLFYWHIGARAGHEGPKLYLQSDDDNRVEDAHRGALWGNSGSYAFGQQYAYDLTVLSWSVNRWVERTGDGKQNSDYFAWELPVYAGGNGVVRYCWRDTPDNTTPFIKDPLPTGAPGGGNILWIEYEGGEVMLYAHFRQNSIPTSVCPQNGLQTTTVNVSAGQMIGRIGNAGASDKPHMHIHVQTIWTDNPMDWGQGLPLIFNNIDVAQLLPYNNLVWQDVDRRSFIADSADGASPSTWTLIRVNQ